MSKKNLPAYTCSSCAHCIQKYCQVFKRPVDIKVNRCANHSHYNPNAKPFKVDKNLEIIMKAEEKARNTHYKGYLREAEMLRKLTLKDIEKEKQQRKSA